MRTVIEALEAGRSHNGPARSALCLDAQGRRLSRQHSRREGLAQVLCRGSLAAGYTGSFGRSSCRPRSSEYVFGSHEPVDRQGWNIL